MKIRIKPERYGITAAPSITKNMMEYFWEKKYFIIDRQLGHHFPIESINIRINQALPWMDYHFYVTINNDVESEDNTFHIQFNKSEVERYFEDKKSNSYLQSDYNKGYKNTKWNFLYFCLGYSVKELNIMFGLN